MRAIFALGLAAGVLFAGAVEAKSQHVAHRGGARSSSSPGRATSPQSAYTGGGVDGLGTTLTVGGGPGYGGGAGGPASGAIDGKGGHAKGGDPFGSPLTTGGGRHRKGGGL